jgi:hypothetical protein
MEVALDTAAKQAADADGYRASNIITADASERAETFLEVHPTAKIIVVIDTHSLDNGFLLWRGTAASNYQACSLLEVGAVSPYVSCTKISIDLDGLHPAGDLPIPLQFCGNPWS